MPGCHLRAARWHDVLDLPVLAFDHKLIVRRSLRWVACCGEVDGCLSAFQLAEACLNNPEGGGSAGRVLALASGGTSGAGSRLSSCQEGCGAGLAH